MKKTNMARSPGNNSSSQRWRKRINIPSEEDGDQAGTSSSGSVGVGTKAPSFTKVMLKTAHHSAYPNCRMTLPRKFCEEHGIPKHVTMTNSTGHRRWHMRFQVQRSSACYTISNGWREFSYDHGLAAGDVLVFTLLSSSHFGVEFAASNGSGIRAMHPTRDAGADYPWFINYSRLACLSWQRASSTNNRANNIDDRGDPIEINVAASVANLPNEEGLQGEIIELYSENRLPGVEMATSAQEGDFITSFPKKQNPTGKTEFCQCKIEDVDKQESTLQDSTGKKKKLQLPELTHLECKYEDGTTYLQLFDSDGEIAD